MLEVKPLTTAIGAEIFGADLSRDDHVDAIRQAFIDHSVIAIRDLDLTPDEQIAFARRWGAINVNRFFKPVDGYPEIATVLKEPGQKAAIGEDWHTDHSYDEEPAACSMLYAIETPEVGGDTAFASMSAAYLGLSEEFRRMLGPLKAWHSSRHVFGRDADRSESADTDRVGNADAATQDAVHPLVITHPLSGKPCLYVNRVFTTHVDGWSREESEPLLHQIYSHCVKPEYTCRIRWRPGTLGIWDNRATWHKAINDYHGHRRLMHRITIEGTPLEGAPLTGTRLA